MSGTEEAATEATEVQRVSRTPPREIADADRMREELNAVIESPEFARAPIMKRLLSFLVNETAAGRGDQLKAYSVAVDGLGRAPDYDARADSYPRVQVGRLRRMLDSYYGTTRPAGGMRLAIPSGRYRVTLEPIEQESAEETPPPAEPPAPAQRPRLFGWRLVPILLLVAVAALLLVQLLPMRPRSTDAERGRPVLEMGGTMMARESQLGNLVRITLINGLGRSNLYDLRPLRRSGVRDPNTPKPQYYLGADLVGGERPRLFLRLSRIGPDRLIWSGMISLADLQSPDDVGLNQRLAPVIATIGRVGGLIATHEMQERADAEPLGYGCLLVYHHYRKERTTEERRVVERCIERSLRLDPRDAELQAAAALMAIEKMVDAQTDPRERGPLLLAAQRHAQIAASIDPFDPWGNLARARVALAQDACPQAIGSAIKASELHPYDPALLADAGIHLLNCGDPRAEQLMRRAIALDDDPDGRFHAPLLLVAIARDDPTLAREALARMSAPLLGRHSLLHLISAAGHAMVGDVPRARASWARLEADNPAVAQDPRGFLERVGYATGVRDKAMAHLRRAGLPSRPAAGSM